MSRMTDDVKSDDVKWGEFKCFVCKNVDSVHVMPDACSGCGVGICENCFRKESVRNNWGHEYCSVCDHNACNLCTDICETCKHHHCNNCWQIGLYGECENSMQVLPWWPCNKK